MVTKYILDGHRAMPEPNTIEWAKWFETNDRIVAKTNVQDVHVSTVFLGIDHNFWGGKPLLFETLVFGGKLDGEMLRYTTWDEAEEGHEKMVSRVRTSQQRVPATPPGNSPG